MRSLEEYSEIADEFQYALDETAGEGGLIENLEAIAVDLQSILASGGALNGAGFKMYNIAMRSNLRRIGLDHTDRVPSLESFEDPVTARGATSIALEGVFDAIGGAFKAIWEWITGIFKSIGEFLGLSSKKVEAQDKKIDELQSNVDQTLQDADKVIADFDAAISGKSIEVAKEETSKYKFYKIDRDGTTHVSLSHRSLSILSGGKEGSIKNIGNVKPHITSLAALCDEVSADYLAFMGGSCENMVAVSKRLSDKSVDSLKGKSTINEGVKKYNEYFDKVDTRITAMATSNKDAGAFKAHHFIGALVLTTIKQDDRLNHHTFETHVYETKHIGNTETTIAVSLKDFKDHARTLKDLGQKMSKLEDVKDAINKQIDGVRKAMDEYNASIKEHIKQHGIADIYRTNKQHEYQQGQKMGDDNRQVMSYESLMGDVLRNVGNFVRGLGLISKAVLTSREAVIEVYSDALKFQKKVRHLVTTGETKS